MKANELKANNHLTFTTATNKEVVVKVMGAIDEDGGRVFFHSSQYRDGGQNEPLSYAIARFKPIPLTEEILLKAGFVEGENKWFVKEYSTGFTATEKHEIVYNVDSMRCGIQDVGDGSTTAFTVNTEHLHQLQNLYHALTGEELEINL